MTIIWISDASMCINVQMTKNTNVMMNFITHGAII